MSMEAARNLPPTELPGLTGIGETRADSEPPRHEGKEVMSEALKLVAMREHALLSLSELSQELGISLDLFSLADLVLFNLMGHLGTSRSAMWLVSEGGRGVPVLVRSHGINRQMGKALGSTCTPKLIEQLAHDPGPLLEHDLDGILGATGTRLVDRAQIAMFLAIRAREETLGLIALGRRIGGHPYGTVELQALQASLGMVGVAIQNMTFYNRLLENNRQLRIANENLKSLDHLKAEFLSNVNHELRTPLTCVIAYVDSLLNTRFDNDHAHEFLTVVMEEAQRLQGLLENLLSFSAISQEKLTLDCIVADVRGPLASYYQERLPGVTEGLRELVYTSDDSLPPASFDMKRMLQIVDALIENAIKFTPQGSRIEIHATHTVEDERSWVGIDVEDDGPGIPKDRLPALFDSFRQADGSSTREVGGMGIGLAFARQLAERMGGKLSVESELGKGSVFRLQLPVVDRRSAPRAG